MIKNKINVNKKNTKLVPHLMDTDNYCIHYRNLKYIVGHRVKIKKVAGFNRLAKNLNKNQVFR